MTSPYPFSIKTYAKNNHIWQFGQFDRQSRTMTQDLDLDRVPADLEEVLRILIDQLTNNS